MDKEAFSQDILRKPDVLQSLQGHDFGWPMMDGKRIFFVGMGSSHFAAKTISHRLQRQGINAFAWLASAANTPKLEQDDIVIAITASGNSIETNDFVKRLPKSVILLTNKENVVLENVSNVVQMNATEERGGVSSLSFMATLIALLQLEERLTRTSILSDTLTKSVVASSHILQSQNLWQEVLSEFVSGKDGIQFAAPLERLSSAEQSALMIRECARMKADASEVGDWSHVDVYLTKTQEYRLVLFRGSPWTSQLLDWTSQRGSKVLQIGHGTSYAEFDYPYSDHELVSLLVEVTYAEIAGQTLWYEK